MHETRSVEWTGGGAVCVHGLASLTGIPGPFIASHSFYWALSPEHSWRLPGIAFFEGTALTFIGLALAIRSFRRDHAPHDSALQADGI